MDNRIALSTTPATAEQLIDISPSRRTSDLDNVDLILLYSYEWMEVTRAVEQWEEMANRRLVQIMFGNKLMMYGVYMTN